MFTTRKTTRTCTLILIIANLLLGLPPAPAQSQQPPGLIEKIKRFFFGTRPGGTPSGRQRGGAVRGRCPSLAQPLMALVPSNNEGIPLVEQTISERPTFWFYASYLHGSPLNAEFALLDEQERVVYSAVFPLNQQPGIISLQLPKTMPSLKEENNYHWVFSAICNPQDRAADAIVNGWVERIPVSPALSTQLKVTSAKERPSVYTDAKLW